MTRLSDMARDFVETHEVTLDGERTVDVLERFGALVLAAERKRTALAIVRPIERAAWWWKLGRLLQWWRGCP